MMETKKARMPFAARIRTIPPVRLVVLSFVILILAGALLLTLPAAVKEGTPSFLDGYFTATSATCVTGLVLYDTYQHWTFFGQAVILVLIQCGGLGIATFATGITLVLRRKLGMREMRLAGETSGGSFMNIRALVRLMICFTFACEAVGAVLLAIRFLPLYGFRGIWPSIFIAVSAYCNAGFDVLGFVQGNVSLTAFAQDPLVCLTVAMLIIIGGLGFVVVQDIYLSKISPVFKRRTRKPLNVHSQICLRMTLLLLLCGTVVFLIFEFHGTMEQFTPAGKLIASFFQSASARTAGFASIDIAAKTEFTKVATVILMFIGACPGSTGGGVKVTTMALLWVTVISVLRNKEEVVMSRHKFTSQTIYKALTVVILALFIVFVDTAVIVWRNPQVYFLDAMYESVSAFGTVGLSGGVTPTLDRFSQLMVGLTMFIGRVGPVSLGVSILLRPKKKREAVLPEGKMFIG